MCTIRVQEIYLCDNKKDIWAVEIIRYVVMSIRWRSNCVVPLEHNIMILDIYTENHGYPSYHNYDTFSLSISTPLSLTLNTNPSPSLTPTPTFRTSNLPLHTTSHLWPLSASASSTLNAGANLSTSTLLTASLVVFIRLGQDIGIAGRKELGVVEREVVTIPAEKVVVRECKEEVSIAEAAVRLDLEFSVDADVEFRIDHTNASMSSSMTE
jgi:hypothetical protein